MSLGLAALGAVSSALGAAWNARQANHAAHQNQRYAADQMVFEKQMSDTAHQREIADLRAAGLNPILTATGGNGASTPSGQSGSIAQAGQEDFGHSARDIVKYIDSERGKNIAETNRLNSESDQIKQLTPHLMNTQMAQQDYYRNLSFGQMYTNLQSARREAFYSQHPELFNAQMYGEALTPYVNSALNAIRTGATVYGAKKVGSASGKMSATLGQLRHDQFERGYWRGYNEGGMNRI